jgi:hypothetical protein
MSRSLLIMLLLIAAAAYAVPVPTEKLDKNEEWKCTKWAWAGNEPNLQVWCLRWEKKQKPHMWRS